MSFILGIEEEKVAPTTVAINSGLLIVCTARWVHNDGAIFQTSCRDSTLLRKTHTRQTNRERCFVLLLRRVLFLSQKKNISPKTRKRVHLNYGTTEKGGGRSKGSPRFSRRSLVLVDWVGQTIYTGCYHGTRGSRRWRRITEQTPRHNL